MPGYPPGAGRAPVAAAAGFRGAAFSFPSAPPFPSVSGVGSGFLKSPLISSLESGFTMRIALLLRCATTGTWPGAPAKPGTPVPPGGTPPGWPGPGVSLTGAPGPPGPPYPGPFMPPIIPMGIPPPGPPKDPGKPCPAYMFCGGMFGLTPIMCGGGAPKGNG